MADDVFNVSDNDEYDRLRDVQVCYVLQILMLSL